MLTRRQFLAGSAPTLAALALATKAMGSVQASKPVTAETELVFATVVVYERAYDEVPFCYSTSAGRADCPDKFTHWPHSICPNAAKMVLYLPNITYEYIRVEGTWVDGCWVGEEWLRYEIEPDGRPKRRASGHHGSLKVVKFDSQENPQVGLA